MQLLAHQGTSLASAGSSSSRQPSAAPEQCACLGPAAASAGLLPPAHPGRPQQGLHAKCSQLVCVMLMYRQAVFFVLRAHAGDTTMDTSQL